LGSSVNEDNCNVPVRLFVNGLTEEKKANFKYIQGAIAKTKGESPEKKTRQKIKL